MRDGRRVIPRTLDDARRALRPVTLRRGLDRAVLGADDVRRRGVTPSDTSNDMDKSAPTHFRPRSSRAGVSSQQTQAPQTAPWTSRTVAELTQELLHTSGVSDVVRRSDESRRNEQDDAEYDAALKELNHTDDRQDDRDDPQDRAPRPSFFRSSVPSPRPMRSSHREEPPRRSPTADGARRGSRFPTLPESWSVFRGPSGRRPSDHDVPTD